MLVCRRLASGQPRPRSAQLMKQVLQREFQVPVHVGRGDFEQHAGERARQLSACSSRPASSASISSPTPGTCRARGSRSKRAGFSVIPAPTGYATRRAVSMLLDFVPSAQALLDSSWFFHEVIGLGWYRLRSCASANQARGSGERMKARIKWIENVALRRRVRERARARHGRRARGRRAQPRARARWKRC